jgi:RecA/RadA recombinase
MFYKIIAVGDERKQRLDKAIAGLQGKHGARIVQVAKELPKTVIPPHIASGFADLDAMTGCKGIPLGHITLLTGKTTSGKLTLAYKVLENAQGKYKNKESVAILDLTHASDLDYIARCGVDLAHTLIVRPPHPDQFVKALFHLLRPQYGLRAVLVDGLGHLLATIKIAHEFDAALPQLHLKLKESRCALICLDEAQPPLLRWLKINSSAIAHYASLHINLAREQWLTHEQKITGYTARANLLKSRWARNGPTCQVAITFNGTIKANNKL